MRVLVADDHEVVRTGIRTLLAQTDIEIVGEAVDGEEAVDLTLERRPDLLILDVRMPKSDGLKALGRIKLERPEQPAQFGKLSLVESRAHVPDIDQRTFFTRAGAPPPALSSADAFPPRAFALAGRHGRRRCRLGQLVNA